MKRILKSRTFLPIMGFFAGLANGLLGAGGGIIAVYALSYSLGDEIADRRDVFANALCIMLPISAVSCVSYAIAGNLTVSGIGVYAIPAVLGGIVGGILLGKIKFTALRKLFAALVIYSGIALIIK